MARITSYIIGGATLVCALGTGYVMQYGFDLPGVNSDASAAAVQLELTSITPASSAMILPRLPSDPSGDIALPGDPVVTNAAREVELPLAALPEDPAATGFTCDVTMTASPAAGAMLSLVLDAPCNASERVTLHHQGMMFTEVVQPDGMLSMTVPALAEQAILIASFASGDGAMASAEVTSLPFYDRVVVQWKGDAGLQLHAREFSAAYFSEGHIWASAAGTLTAAAQGEGGFLTRLGRVDAPEALYAEVYSFPSGTAQRSGTVLLSVEAEVTDQNCGRRVEAQTLEIRDGSSLSAHDLTLEMPACETVGDFLVLKNLFEDLTIAKM